MASKAFHYPETPVTVSRSYFYIIICCLPAIAFLLLCLRKKKIRADLSVTRMLCCPLYRHLPDDKSGAYAPYFRYSIPMISLAISTTLWSIFICYIILRVLAIIRYANEINLAKIAQVFIILVMIISIINICFIKSFQNYVLLQIKQVLTCIPGSYHQKMVLLCLIMAA